MFYCSLTHSQGIKPMVGDLKRDATLFPQCKHACVRLWDEIDNYVITDVHALDLTKCQQVGCSVVLVKTNDAKR